MKLQIDWQKATTEFGAASVESMRVMTRSALKKIDAAANGGTVPAKKATPRKRKADADDEGAAKPKKGKGGKKAKKADTPVDGELSIRKCFGIIADCFLDDDEEAEMGGKVKKEEAAEEEVEDTFV